MKIFYSHHLYKYDTKIETYEIELIKKTFPDAAIINPNGDIATTPEMPDEEAMIICIAAVDTCDALVFSSLSGVVGKGVYDEVNHAFDTGKSVYYIEDNKVKPIVKVEYEIINEVRRIYANVTPVQETLKICESCIHKDVCSLKEKLAEAKKSIKVPENFKDNYPFIMANFYCKNYTNKSCSIIPSNENLV